MESVKAINVYRNLVRAAKLAFKNDAAALNASRDKLRQEYAVPVRDRADFLKRVQYGKDVAHILRCNVVQGIRNDKGNYKLDIHKETELGDNDSRFNGKIVDKGESTGCCGGGKPSPA